MCHVPNVITIETNNMLICLTKLPVLVQPSEQMKCPLITYKWNRILRIQLV